MVYILEAEMLNLNKEHTMSVSNEVKEILKSKPNELLKAIGVTLKEAQEQIEKRYPSLTAEAAYREWEASKYGLDGRKKGSYLMVFEKASFDFPERLSTALDKTDMFLIYDTKLMSWAIGNGKYGDDNIAIDLVVLSARSADVEEVLKGVRTQWQNQ